MRALHPVQLSSLVSPEAAALYANFLALNEQGQAFRGENEDWNRKKANFKKPRRWSKKRQLIPPGAKAKTVRRSGAQPCNENRRKHGKFAQSWQLFRGEIRCHVRASYALVAYAYAVHCPPAKPAEAVSENSA